MSINVNDKDLGLVTAYAYAVSKGYEGTEEEFAELMASYAETAETAVEAALKSEGHAIGEQDGVPVGSDSPYYQNNSKYYSEQAAGSATTASDKASEASGSASSASGSADSASANALKSEGYAVGKQNGADVASDSPYYHTNAKYYSEQASADATQTGLDRTQTGLDRTQTGLDVASATASASSASTNALKSEGFAVGKQNGTPVASGSPYYENNAEYYAGQAAQSAEEAAASAGDYLKAFPHETTSGSIVTIPDGADDIPVRDLVVNIEPVQSGTGDPSPTNVRPISGWTGVEVTRTGGNLFGGEFLADTIVAKVPNAVKDTTAKTIAYSAANITGKVIFDKFKPNTQYTFMLKQATGSNNTNIRILYTDNTRTDINYPVVVSESGKSIASLVGIWSTGNGIFLYEECGIFEGVLTEFDFKPYIGQIYPISWQSSAGTVYGGTLDVTTGKLVLDRAKITFDGSDDETWAVTVALVFYHTTNATAFPYKFSSTCKAISDKYKYIGTRSGSYNTSLNNGEFLLYYSSGQATREIAFRNTSVADVSAWRTALSSSPIDVVYELATPVEYTLTAEELSTLLGTNNVWADCGSVSLDYRADTTLFIEQLTKPTEDDMTANANIASGKFFMIGNRLFLSTTAIAQGEQIVVGTNCSEVSLADALNQINA